MTGCTLDRDKARNALIWMQQNGGLDMYGWDDCLDRLAACVRPVAGVTDPQTVAVVDRSSGRELGGVVLDVIETRIAHGWYLDVALRQKVSAEETALADRLRKAI